MNLSYFISRKLRATGSGRFVRVVIQLATASIALSLAVMIIANALVNGFQKEIREKIFGFWGHIQVTHTATSEVIFAKPLQEDPELFSGLDTMKQLTYKNAQPGFFEQMGIMSDAHTSYGGIDHIQTFAQVPGILTHRELFEGLVIKGVGQDFNWTFLNRYLKKGRLPNVDTSSVSRELLISVQTARRMELELGDRVIIHFVHDNRQLRRRFTICGLYRTGLEEYDQRFAIADIRAVRNVLGWSPDQVAGYEMFLDDLRDLEVWNDYLYFEHLPRKYYSETVEQTFPAIFEWLELQNINEQVIIGLMLLVAVINMITILLILILERTHMIGILKALGSTNAALQKVFLWLGGYILIRAMLIGNGVALLLCFVQDRYGWITLNETDYYLSVAPVHIDVFELVLINAGSILITMICLLLPVWIISRIRTLQALRFS